MKGAAAEQHLQYIPGGKLLARYVCRVIALCMRDHYGPLIVRGKRQVEALRGRVDLKGYVPCAHCCYVGLSSRMIECGNVITHGRFCPDCLFEGCCPACTTTCMIGTSSNTTTTTKCGRTLSKAGSFECHVCHGDLCADHYEYCRFCGDTLCATTKQQKAANELTCRAKHECHRKKLFDAAAKK